MNWTTALPKIILIMLGVILFVFSSVFIVDQTERAITLRLGNIVTMKGGVAVSQPGLHLKIPFIDDIKYFDYRMQTLKLSSSRIPTAEKKELIVDLFVKWKINNVALFFKSTSNQMSRANVLLEQRIVDGLRAEIGRRQLKDMVNVERQRVMEKVRADVTRTAKNLGLKVVDVRIVRMDLPKQVSDSVFELMRTERHRIALEHRAKGESRANTIQAEADKKVIVILAEADRTAKELRGDGDAQAAVIFAKAYGQDPEFYKFYRSLQAYKETFKATDGSVKNVLVTNPNNEFFKYFSNNK